MTSTKEKDMSEIYYTLVKLYGTGLVAATVTVLIRQGDEVRFLTNVIPQIESKGK